MVSATRRGSESSNRCPAGQLSIGFPPTARASGFAEIIEDGVSGILVQNGDVAALAEGLIAILDRHHFAGGLPPEVIQRVSDRHDLTRHIARMRSTFTEVVAA